MYDLIEDFHNFSRKDTQEIASLMLQWWWQPEDIEQQSREQIISSTDFNQIQTITPFIVELFKCLTKKRRNKVLNYFEEARVVDPILTSQTRPFVNYFVNSNYANAQVDAILKALND